MRSALAALLLAAAVLAAWWWWPDAPPAPQPIAGSQRAAANVATAARPAPASAADAVADGRELVAATGPPPLPGDAVMVDVQVVDETTREPIAGADVWWTDATTAARVAALQPAARARLDADEEARHRRFGWHTVADARGMARVHAHPQATNVIARGTDRWGFVDVRRRDAGSVVVLMVRRDHEVAVRVVDAAGAPVPDVPVGIADCPSRPTDAAGLVLFRHVQHLAGRDADGGWTPCDAEVWLAIPGCEDVRTTFPVLSPPRQPLTLVLPPTGALRVRVAGAAATVDGIEVGVLQGDRIDPAGHAGGLGQITGSDGVAYFAHVPLQHAFAVSAQVAGIRLHATVEGPRTAGEVVETTLEVPGDACFVAGRAVTAGGAPVAGAELSGRFALSRGNDGHVHVRTDDGGRFRYLVHVPSEGACTLAGFDLWWHRGPLELLRGRVAPRELCPGMNDAGDVVLAAQPLVVAGRLVFDAGRFDDSVRLHVQRWLDDLAGGAWQVEHELEWHRAADGRFVVRGSPPPGRLRMHFGDLAAPVEFERGTEHLDVRIARNHSLTFVCTLPPGMAAQFVRYSLRAEPAAPEQGVREEGACEWHQRAVMREERLPAGRYTLTLFCEGVTDPLATERGIELPGPGGECDRTVELDLSERVPVVRLRVAGPDGEVPDKVFAFVDQDPQRGLQRCVQIVGGALTWPVPPRAVDVTIVGEQWRTAELRGVRGDADVRLERAPRIELRAAGVPPLPDGYELRVVVDAPRGPGATDWLPIAGGGSAPLAQLTAQADARTVAPGAVWTIRASDAQRAISAMLRIGGRGWPLRIVPDQVPAGAGTVTITFDPADVLAAIEADQNRDTRK